jgi:hypothetical protein
MKLSDYRYWPPEWGAVLKQRLSAPSTNLIIAPDFCERAILERFDELINGNPPVVTINVKHPDYQGLVAGNLRADSELVQRRLYELFRTNLGLRVSEIGNLLFD